MDSLNNRLAINSLSGAGRFVAVTLIYLVTYPLLINSLGSARFGLWALLGIAGQYIALGDFGVSNALIKLAAEVSDNSDTARFSRLAGAATATFILLGGALVTTISWGQHEILTWLRIEPELLAEARLLLLGMAGVMWLTLLGNVYTSLLSGLHRMDLANAVHVAGLLLNAVGIFLVLRLGGGLVALMLNNAITALAVWLMSVILTQTIIRLRWTFAPGLHWPTIVSLMRFGLYLYVAALASLLLEPAMKVLLSRYGNLQLVSSFELASRIVTQSRSLFYNMLLPILPASSLLMSDLKEIRALFSRSMRLLWATATPFFLVLAGLSTSVVGVWLGRDIPLVQNGIVILSVGWFLNILTVPAYLLVQGMGFPRHAMLCSVVQGLLAVLGGSILIPYVGFYGATYSMLGALVLAASYIFRQFLRLCPMSFGDIFGNSVRRTFVAPAVLGFTLYLCGSVLQTRSIWKLGLLVLATFALYTGLLYWAKAPGIKAQEFIRSYLPRVLVDGVFSKSRR